MKFYACIIGLVVLALSLAWPMTMEAPKVHAQVDDFSETSNPDAYDIRSLYIPLREYSEMHHNLPAGDTWVNWPRRRDSDDGPSGGDYWCPSTSATYKSMPWIGGVVANNQVPKDYWLDRVYRENGWSDDDQALGGNFFDLSGTCENWTVDGGTSTRPFSAAGDVNPPGRGAWLNRQAFGGWTSETYAEWMVPPEISDSWSDAVRTDTGAPVDTSQFNDAPRMWGTGQKDLNRHDNTLWQENGFGEPSTDWDLYSNGTTLFRHELGLSPQQTEFLRDNPDAELVIEGLADDWMQLYFNGSHIFSTTRTIGTDSFEEPLSAGDLVNTDGTPNVIAVQAVDKGIWSSSGAASRLASGVHYEVRIEFDGDLGDFNIETDITTSGRQVEAEENININAYAKNVGDVTSDSVDLEVVASGDTGSITPNNRNKGVGTLNPGQREDETYGFSVRSNAEHGDKICFESKASPKTSSGGTATSSNKPCFTVVREFKIKTDLTGNDDEDGKVRPGITYDAVAKAWNQGSHTSTDIDMGVKVGKGSTELSGWSNPNWDLGEIDSGDEVSEEFSFTVADDAEDGKEICFGSWAKPQSHDNPTRTYSPGAYKTYCVEVVRRFDMRVNIQQPPPGKDYDVLSGDIYIKAWLGNMYGPDVDGKRTDEELTATITVDSGGEHVTPLKGVTPSTPQKNRVPDDVNPNRVEWIYGGGSHTNQHFKLRSWLPGTPNEHKGANDHDLIEARTQVKHEDSNGTVCFIARISPRFSTSTGGNGSFHSDNVCVQVHPVDGPYATTEDGDVHGGSVMVDSETAQQTDCRLDDGSNDRPRAQVWGRTRTSPDHGSKSTYAVSATGRIRSFGSGNSIGSKVLKFGNISDNGYYRSICRPDLTSDEHYERLGYKVFTESRRNIRGTINQINNEAGKYSDGDEFVVRLTNSSPKFAGTDDVGVLKKGKRVTFIAEEDFRIQHNLRVEDGPRDDRGHIPAIAIIGEKDIDIHSQVDSINAYLGSNDTIDTCGNVVDIENNVGACDNNYLEIRGAMVAKEIHFRRTKDDVNSSNPIPSEKITFAPEMYLAPPPGLYGVTNNIFINTFMRERPPLF